MATYLALVDIGDGKLVQGQIGRLPTWTLIDPRLVKKSVKVETISSEFTAVPLGIRAYRKQPRGAARKAETSRRRRTVPGRQRNESQAAATGERVARAAAGVLIQRTFITITLPTIRLTRRVVNFRL